MNRPSEESFDELKEMLDQYFIPKVEIERMRRVEKAARSLIIFAKNVPSIYLRDLNDLMAALEEK